MRIAFVVQRYGVEVNGGAEQHCRALVERVARRSDVGRVEVWTSCARDYHTWRNHYPAGGTTVQGIAVRRFPVVLPRLSLLQDALGLLALRGPRLRALEIPWILAQGPWAPGLVRHVAAEAAAFDAFVFFSYLYFPTVFGLPYVADRAVFVPTAHDEPALQMRIAGRAFRRAAAIAFNTHEERELASPLMGPTPPPNDVVGCGVTIDHEDASAERRRAPYLLYLGRIEAGKGVPELLRQFARFRQEHGRATFQSSAHGPYRGSDLELVLAGRSGGLQVAAGGGVVPVGFVSDERRVALLRGAEAMPIPGTLDSLSLVILEAWQLGCPVLVPAACAVKCGHVIRAEVGEIYGSQQSFGAALSRLLASPERRRRYAAKSAAYVREQYAWPVVEERFMALVARAGRQGGQA